MSIENIKIISRKELNELREVRNKGFRQVEKITSIRNENIKYPEYNLENGVAGFYQEWRVIAEMELMKQEYEFAKDNNAILSKTIKKIKYVNV